MYLELALLQPVVPISTCGVSQPVILLIAPDAKVCDTVFFTQVIILGEPVNASRWARRARHCFDGVCRAACLLLFRHRMKQGYPLNLSISLSGGEETNQDAPSNGE